MQTHKPQAVVVGFRRKKGQKKPYPITKSVGELNRKKVIKEPRVFKDIQPLHYGYTPKQWKGFSPDVREMIKKSEEADGHCFGPEESALDMRIFELTERAKVLEEQGFEADSKAKKEPEKKIQLIKLAKQKFEQADRLRKKIKTLQEHAQKHTPKRKKTHGPRYSIEGKTRSWVTRDSKGRFKKWTGKKKSLAADRVRRAPKGTTPGYGFKKDYYAPRAIAR
jgi:hypothetical protein